MPRAAAILRAKWELGLNGGVLIANPIPEEYGMDFDEMEGVIRTALEAAEAAGVHGKEITPFLLAKVKDLTGGDSLDSNIQLVFNNARLAAKLTGWKIDIKPASAPLEPIEEPEEDLFAEEAPADEASAEEAEAPVEEPVENETAEAPEEI